MCRVRGRRNDARALVLREALSESVRLSVPTEPPTARLEKDLARPLAAIADSSVEKLDPSVRALPSGDPSLGQMLSQARAKRPDYLFFRQ